MADKVERRPLLQNLAEDFERVREELGVVGALLLSCLLVALGIVGFVVVLFVAALALALLPLAAVVALAVWGVSRWQKSSQVGTKPASPDPWLSE
jgi:hypothetical protein